MFDKNKVTKCITDFQIDMKRVFLRLDLNVPMKDQQIVDETRISLVLPTIQYALDQGARLVVASHLGRPRPENKANYSLIPIANYLSEKLNIEVLLMGDVKGDAPKHLITSLSSSQIIMLENLRFDLGEEQNSHTLASHFAGYTDVYINDAFSVSHRAHASIVALPQMVENKGIGFLVQKELSILDSLFQAESPFVLILGGAKVSDKIGMMQNLMERIDTVIVGGAMAYTFLKAQGVDVGDSFVQKDQIQAIKNLLNSLAVRDKSCLLPIDHVMCPKSSKDLFNISPEHFEITDAPSIKPGYVGCDIGPQTLQKYKDVIAKSKTIFWNGPMGLFETPPFDKGTFEIAKAVSQADALSIVGGGDSVAAIKKSGYTAKHLSTGGGASLKYLQGQSLIGLDVLNSYSS